MGARWERARNRAQRVATHHMGESVTYTPAAEPEAAATVVAVFDNEFTMVNPSGQMETTSTKPRFALRLAELPATPKQDDTITRENGDVYRVVDMQPDGEGMCDMICHAAAPRGTAPSFGAYWPT